MPPRQRALIVSLLNTCPARRHALRRIATTPVLLSSCLPTSTGGAYYSTSRSVISTSYPYAYRTRDPSRLVRDACTAACTTPTRVPRHYQGSPFINRHWGAYIQSAREAMGKLPFNAHTSGYKISKSGQTNYADLALQIINDPVQISTVRTIRGRTSLRSFDCGLDLGKLVRNGTVRNSKYAVNYTVGVEKTTQSKAYIQENAVEQTLTLLHKRAHKSQRVAKGRIVSVNRPNWKSSPPVRETSLIHGVNKPQTIHVLGSKWSKKINNAAIRVTPSHCMVAPYSTAGYMEARLASRCALQSGNSLPQGPSSEPLSQHVQGNDAGDDLVDHNDYCEASSSNCNNNNTPHDADNPSSSDTPKVLPSVHPSTAHDDNDTDMSDLDSTDVEPEHVPLRFQIPPAALRCAMSASENSAGSFYNQSLYRGPNGELISIHYCHTMEIAERVAKYFLKVNLLGFDIEWKPYASPHLIKENASLIQLACEDRIALFHIALYQGTTASELLPASLKTIIESRDICKVGVAIKGDFSRLERCLGVKPRGVFELSRLHNLVTYSGIDSKRAGSKKLYSLAKQTQQHLQLPLSKGVVRESDWSQRLKFDQITYAATDAYASFRIFDILESKRKKLKPIPPRPLLCDFDPTPQPKATPSTKTSRTTPKPSGNDDISAAVGQLDEDNDSTQYETTAEELMDSHELEDSSDEESSTPIQEHSGDPNTDYPSAIHHTGRLKALALQDDQQTEPPEYSRVGRIDITALAGRNPEHPALPDISRNEDIHSNTGDTCDPPTQSPEWTAANHWAQEYSYSSIPSVSSPPPTRPRIRATIPHLRAYHMWRHQKMNMNEIAKHLRDPPLAESTVASYILQAVMLEKLEYQSEDLKDVLKGLPRALRVGRWRWLVEKVGGI